MIDDKSGYSPLVSVIIPCYNAELTIVETLDSIFSQDYKSLEIIVVDDGSTDTSLEIVNHYKSRYNNLFVISQDNQGPSAARNTGLTQAKGAFVTFVDSDDLIKDSFITKLLKPHLADPELVLSYCNVELFERRTGILNYEELIIKRFLMRNCIPAFAMINRSKLQAIGGFDVNLRSHEDWECWIRLFKEYGVKSYKCESPLYLYRQRNSGDSLTDLYNIKDVVDKTYLYIYNKHYDFYRTHNLSINTLFYSVIGLDELQAKKKSKWFKRLFNSHDI